MPDGKPAGVRCIHLTDDHRCALFGSPDRPEVCNNLRASVEMCGDDARHAFDYLARLERLTRRDGNGATIGARWPAFSKRS